MTQLSQVFDGWNGYNTSILHAVARLSWFLRMDAPGIEAVELSALGGHIIEPPLAGA
jgi:hypothetical protein